MKKKTGFPVLMALVITILVMGTIFFPRQVAIQADFLHWQTDDPSISGTKTVTLSGIYRRRFIRNDFFEGTLTIDGVTNSWGSTNCRIVFYETMGENSGTLYLLRGEKKVLMGTLWSVYCTPDLEQIHFLFPPSMELWDVGETTADETVLWSITSSGVLSYPAATRKEALELLTALSKNKDFATGG